MAETGTISDYKFTAAVLQAGAARRLAGAPNRPDEPHLLRFSLLGSRHEKAVCSFESSNANLATSALQDSHQSPVLVRVEKFGHGPTRCPLNREIQRGTKWRPTSSLQMQQMI